MKLHHQSLIAFLLLGSCGAASASDTPVPKTAQQDKNHQTMPASMPMGETEEMAHPFLTHMGLPDAVGTRVLRFSGLTTSADGNSRGDIAFHFETGLAKRLGIHLRNDEFTTDPFTEVMFQYAAFTSKDGMSGISPLIEFEFPTRREGSGIKTMFGFSSTLALKHGEINQVLHYNPKEEMLEGSIAYVFEASKGVYPVIEFLGEAMKGDSPTINVLFGPKVRVGKSTLLGIAFESPISARKEFGSKFIFQLEFKW